MKPLKLKKALRQNLISIRSNFKTNITRQFTVCLSLIKLYKPGVTKRFYAHQVFKPTFSACIFDTLYLLIL